MSPRDDVRRAPDGGRAQRRGRKPRGLRAGPQGHRPRSAARRCSRVFGPRGCCTSCAVRVKSGQIRQPEALGISAELKSKGYALLCVGFPSSDLEVETQDEDEVYWLQFGRYFARGPIERDDYALELAMGDE